MTVEKNMDSIKPVDDAKPLDAKLGHNLHAASPAAATERPGSRGLDRCALMLYLTFPLANIAAAGCLTFWALLRGGLKVRSGMLAYLCWICFFDRTPERGGYNFCWRTGITQKLRASFFWKWAARYFPVRLHAVAPLPPDQGPYIFVCHPHGIFGISPMTHFGTDATDFSKIFPGIQVHLLGHSAIFRIPFFREWVLMHGHGSVGRSTCQSLLRSGKSIGLAPGGARESLESGPKTMKLFLRRRRGFAKLALQTGAALVPVIGFGENDLYSTVQFKSDSWARLFQERLQKMFGFALPIFCGRYWCPLLPKRLPVDSVVGPPIRPEAIVPEPSEEAVAAFHAKYCEALRHLFETNKARFGEAEMDFEIV